jgi:hypothetical protein
MRRIVWGSLCALCLSCAPAAPEGGPRAEGLEVVAGEVKASALATPAPLAPGQWWRPAQAPAPVACLAWDQAGRLLIGYQDGQLATVDPRARQSRAAMMRQAPAPILAISPDGAQVMVMEGEGVLIKVADTSPLMRINEIPPWRAMAWSPSGAQLLVVDKNHRIHVWEGVREMSAATVRSLTDLVNRHTPDYSFQFPATLMGPIAYTPGGVLVLGDAQGEVMLFDLHGERMTWTLFSLGAPVRSLAVGKNAIFAQADDGQVRGATVEPSRKLKWTKDERADAVAGDIGEGERVAWMRAQSVGVRQVSDGAWLWESPRPPGEPCGLALDRDGERLAACVGGVIGVFDARTGAPAAWLARQGADLTFGP